MRCPREHVRRATRLLSLADTLARRHYVTIIMRAELPQVRSLRACIGALR